MSDNFAEGWVILFQLIGTAVFILGIIEPVVLYWLLEKITNRKIHLAVFCLALLPGCLLMNWIAANLGGILPVLCAFLFIGPVALFIPPYIYPDLIDPPSRAKRIFSAYMMIVLFEMYLLSGALSPLIDFDHMFFRPVFISATLAYIALIILDSLVAYAVYRLLQALSSAKQIKDVKPV